MAGLVGPLRLPAIELEKVSVVAQVSLRCGPFLLVGGGGPSTAYWVIFGRP
jgi:hypothetical protein